jgi:uncharacterized protein YdaU (DUF1376 family)
MSSRPWMPFYVADFQADTLDLKTDEVGTYFLLICLAWHRGDGSVSGDMKELKLVLSRLCSDMHGNKFNRIVPKLLSRYFQRRGDGRFYQKRVEKELETAQILSRKNSENALKRWSKPKEFNGIVHALAMPNSCYLQSHIESSTNSESENGAEPPQAVGEKRTKSIASPYLAASLHRKGWA